MNLNTEWLNQNAYRRYPLLDDCDLTCSVLGTLSNDVLLEARFTAIVPLVNLRLVSVGVLVSGYTKTPVFSFMYDTYDQAGALASGVTLVVQPLLTGSTPYVIHAFDGSVYSQLVCGAGLVAILAASDVTITATLTTPAPLLPSTYSRLDKHAVYSLTGTAAGSTPVVGPITVDDGYGIVPTTVDNTLALDAVPGTGLGYPAVRSDPARPACNSVLLALNTLKADPTGAVYLIGAKGFRVSNDPATHTITISPTMSYSDLKASCV